MAETFYQTGVQVLGGITPDPYHLNLYQTGIQVLGGITPNSFNYTSTGSLTLSGISTVVIPYRINYVASGNLTMDEISSFKIIFGSVIITYSAHHLNYNFSIDAFKSRTILQAHMKIY